MMNYYLDHWHFHLLLSNEECEEHSFAYIILHMFFMQTCNLNFFDFIIVPNWKVEFNLLSRLIFHYYTNCFCWKNRFHDLFFMNCYKNFISYSKYGFDHFKRWFILIKRKSSKINFAKQEIMNYLIINSWEIQLY